MLFYSLKSNGVFKSEKCALRESMRQAIKHGIGEWGRAEPRAKPDVCDAG